MSLSELLTTESRLRDRTVHVPQTMDRGWWQPMVGQSFRPDVQYIPLTLENALVRSLKHSKQVQVFAELPLIRETAITESAAAFDWSVFMDSRWDDLSDPVGNTQTAGPGITRFRDHNLTFSGGLQRRTRTGGSVEISQQFGIQENNSQFFIPNNQGTSRLVLGFNQPLMRGRGSVYNRSLLCLAKIDRRIADDEFRRQLQAHLMEVNRSYWGLYLERGIFLQKIQSYRRALETMERLKARGAIDASKSQIKSSQAAVSARAAELVRSRTAVRNADARLRSLVNDPHLGSLDETEIVPTDQMVLDIIQVDSEGALAEALQNRSEILQAHKQIHSASIRCQMSKHELMPVLNLITETYLAGLEGRRDITGAWNNQFSEGEPGYSVGLHFEAAINNRPARARHRRRLLELRQTRNQYEITLENVALEVGVAEREVHTAKEELFAKWEAMVARREHLEFTDERWTRLPGEGVSAALVMDNMLNAQERLAIAEAEYLRAQMIYNLSVTNLRKATGTLIQHESILIQRKTIHGLPSIFLEKPERLTTGSKKNASADQPSTNLPSSSTGSTHPFTQISSTASFHPVLVASPPEGMIDADADTPPVSHRMTSPQGIVRLVDGMLISGSVDDQRLPPRAVSMSPAISRGATRPSRVGQAEPEPVVVSPLTSTSRQRR